MLDDRNLPEAQVGLKILVVEDECVIALDIQMILENAGYRVLGPAHSIEESTQLLDEDRAEAAILDVNLSGGSIVVIAQRLYRRGIPFVVASAYRSLDFTDSKIVMAAENIGKPFSEERLVAALGRVLTGPVASHAAIGEDGSLPKKQDQTLVMKWRRPGSPANIPRPPGS